MTQPADDDISHLDFEPTLDDDPLHTWPDGRPIGAGAAGYDKDGVPLGGYAVPIVGEGVSPIDPPTKLGPILNPASLGKEHAATPDRPTMGRTVAAQSETVEGDIYTVTFLIPAEVQLNPAFDDMVHDEGLAHAHFKNLMPVGPTFSTVEPADDVPDYQMADLARQMPSNLTSEQALKEAERLSGRKARPAKQIKVTVQMQIGAQM